MYIPKIGNEDQAQAKAAVKAAIKVLLDGGVGSVVTVSGRWKATASRDARTGYHIHLVAE